MTVTAWDEPAGATPRGTLSSCRGGARRPAGVPSASAKRLAADAYRVRLVAVDDSTT